MDGKTQNPKLSFEHCQKSATGRVIGREYLLVYVPVYGTRDRHGRGHDYDPGGRPLFVRRYVVLHTCTYAHVNTGGRTNAMLMSFSASKHG